MGTIAVNNGRKAQVRFGTYSGTAGVVEIEGETQVAFTGDAGRFSEGQQGTIDDAPYAVRKAVRSETVRGMAVLTVERVGDTA